MIGIDLSALGCILGITDDEAILAKSIRSYCKDELVVDEHGKRVKIASIKCFQDVDTRSIYVVNISCAFISNGLYWIVGTIRAQYE